MPSVWHVTSVPPAFIGREAVTATLDVVVHELTPLAATFFTLDGNEHIRSSVVHGPDLPAAELIERVRGWEERLQGLDPLGPAALAELPGRLVRIPDAGGVPSAYEQIGVINDVRLLIRDGAELVAGLTLWRRLRGATWSDRELRLAGALQPLIELGYVSNVRQIARIDAQLPGTLTARQRQVARLLAAGATTPDIARSLFVSPNTAKSHTRAVMTKLGVSSRRALAMRFAQEPEPQPPARPEPSAPVSLLEGDRGPARLLDAVLEWASERLGAAVGGCVFLSTRLEPTGEAWGTTRADRELRLAWRLHRQLLGQSMPPELVSYLDADPAQRRVVQLDLTDFPANEELDGLLAGAGLASPLLAVLRAHGRLAGLVWVCRDAIEAPDVSESARAFRRVHTLMELSNVTGRAADRSRTTGAADLAELGLTPREIKVAQLALAGKANTAIATSMGISESTVKKHMTRILAKCSVRSRTQLIALPGLRQPTQPADKRGSES
jgi:DNA-binding NarL/FixJ family response regulator